MVFYATIGVLAAVFLGTQVAPCFGVVPTGQATPECLAAWQATRTIWDKMFDTPIGALLIFGVLTAGTLLIAAVGARRSSPAK